MLDLARIQRIKLSTRPLWQRVIANMALWPNYAFAPGVGIDVEGLDNLPREGVVLAMNHTDRYNYWPFQYALYRRQNRFTATWVKGKYYEHPMLAAFMEATNNIPVASRGYLVTRDFINALGRRPTDVEYEALRLLTEAASHGEMAAAPELPALAPVLTKPRNMLGRPFEPSHETYAHALNALHDAMMAQFVSLNERSRELGLHILVFPQGTRSVRLSRGHIGVAQMALHLGVDIVPVGCSGADGVYPSGSPWAKRGHIVYRIGEPLTKREMVALGAPAEKLPFCVETERRHRASLQAITDAVMERINGLVDPPYRFSEDRQSQGVQGTARFV